MYDDYFSDCKFFLDGKTVLGYEQAIRFCQRHYYMTQREAQRYIARLQADYDARVKKGALVNA